MEARVRAGLTRAVRLRRGERTASGRVVHYRRRQQGGGQERWVQFGVTHCVVGILRKITGPRRCRRVALDYTLPGFIQPTLLASSCGHLLYLLSSDSKTAPAS
jgi:hypothetical protein